MTFEATKGRNLTAALGLMFDTTIALARIILAGLLEEHPNLKLVCPHVGGTLPYLIGRLDHQTMVLKRGAENIKKPPSEYLKQVYLDVVTPLPLAIKFAYDMVGPDKLLYGSDHPWVDPSLIIDSVKGLGLPARDERKIFRDNAMKLFGREGLMRTPSAKSRRDFLQSGAGLAVLASLPTPAKRDPFPLAICNETFQGVVVLPGLPGGPGGRIHRPRDRPLHALRRPRGPLSRPAQGSGASWPARASTWWVCTGF